MLKIFTISFLLSATLPVRAQLMDDLTICKMISTEDKRLACFDNAVTNLESKKATYSKPAQKDGATISDKSGTLSATASDRSALAKRMELVFLKAGIDISVFPNNQLDEIDRDRHVGAPKLVFFGYLNRPLVYNIQTKGNVLDQARAIGFKTVEFNDKGGKGRWSFDLSKSGRVCSRDLCF